MTLPAIFPRYIIEAFTGALECAAWSSTDEDGNPFDSDVHSRRAYAEVDLLEFLQQLCDFVRGNWADCKEYVKHRGWDSLGHDFWLTRNGHGAGFWDRGLGPLGQRLTDAAKVYGEANLYVRDDELIGMEL